MKAVRLNRILIVLAFVGLFIAGVLSLEAKFDLLVPCGSSGGCATVAASPASHIAGIPVAYFGLLGYLALALLAVYRSTVPAAKWGGLVTFGYLLSAVGSAESLWLQYQSFFVIHAECYWCISSAILMIGTLVIYALLAQEVDNVATALRSAEAGATEGVDMAAGAASPVRPDFPLALGLGLGAIAGVVVVGMFMKPGRFGAKPAPSNIDAKQLVPVGAHILGQPTSPVTVVEFMDLLCPTCQRISPQVKEFVLSHPGKVRLVLRNFPLVNVHKEAMTAAAIGECAADEGRFWEYAAAVMALNRQPKDKDELFQIAKSVGLDDEKIKKRLTNADDPAYARLARDLATVHAIGINQTPTFFTIYNGKPQETIGSNEILDSLNSPKYQKIENGPPAKVDAIAPLDDSLKPPGAGAAGLGGPAMPPGGPPSGGAG